MKASRLRDEEKRKEQEKREAMERAEKRQKMIRVATGLT
jgi:hypothetical protein